MNSYMHLFIQLRNGWADTICLMGLVCTHLPAQPPFHWVTVPYSICTFYIKVHAVIAGDRQASEN